MFFESVDEISKIAGKVGTSVFVVPPEIRVEIPGAIALEPDGKVTITIEQVREILGRLSVKQLTDLFILIRPADKLGAEAANALLKNLEEPGEKVHFVLVTSEPSKLLPTILSRAAVYVLKTFEAPDGDLKADAKVLELAKRLIAAKPREVVELAEEISKKKDREYALTVLATTIEMLYKSYFKTGKVVFMQKIPKFMQAYENISMNGHIKLHLVADLV